MSLRTPSSLSKFCRQVLPPLLRETRGKRILNIVKEVVETDRWNSFDRFHDTTRTLVRHYEEAGATAEVESIQTGGRIGSGRWIIQQAEDVHAATVDIVEPVKQRLLDYKENPWHAIQWTAATPAEGSTSILVVIDSVEELRALPPDGLVGKTVLTKLSPRSLIELLADKGAAGVITDIPVPDLPDAVAWTKFGWGGVPMGSATAQLVGLVISANQGKRLRRLVEQHGILTLHTRVDSHRYVGTHDVVSGLIRGGGDPQDEVWVLAHSAEPGAIDNASGVALCVEMAQVIESLIARGKLPRPRRTIRLLNAYECYGFFPYLERMPRLQTPMAGVVIDTLGSRPEVCDGRLEWHATIPMSAGFVDWVGEAIIRATLRRHNPGYKLHLEPFMSTADTLIGDPQYGFPCPWITTHHRDSGSGFDAYHTSADTLKLLSPAGLKTCAAAMAGYLYFLADAGSREVVELATSQTQRSLRQLDVGRKKITAEQVRYLRDEHHANMEQLKRWMWGGDRGQIMKHLAACEREVAQAGKRAARPQQRRSRVPEAGRRVPRRTAPLSPDSTNTPPAINARIGKAGLSPWTLFWADGKRNLAEIAAAATYENVGSLGVKGKVAKAAVQIEQVAGFFEAHAELGYVELMDPAEMATRSQLVADFKKLGLEEGMDVMVHSSLSSIGPVKGGADTVVDALLGAIGRRGNLMMPSFNHGAGKVFNPLTTPCTNGAIPDAMWRRPEAVRSLHPTHPVAVIGPRAEAFCRDHLEVGIWEQDSPIGRLVHGGGYILSLGVKHNSSTAYHVAEVSVPCGCLDAFGNPYQVVGEDGQIRQVEGLAWRAGTCPVALEKMDQTLDRRQLQRHGKIGAADAQLVLALDLWKVRREHLRKVCPGCTIKPGMRK